VLASGFIIEKTESEQLAKALWPTQAGDPWKQIYFLDLLETYDNIPIGDFNDLVHYEHGMPPRRTQLLTSQVTADSVIDWLGAPEERILAGGDRGRVRALLEAIEENDDDLDLEGARLYRLQQSRERSDGNRLKVLEKKGYVCEVCGFDFALQFSGLPPSAHVHHKSPLALGNGARSL
jgi:hypothetical protein